MNRELFGQAIVKFFSGLLLVGLLVFVPAGTLHFPYGWLFLGILFVPMFLAGLVMMAKDPELLRRRLNAKEEEAEQRTVILLSGLLFLAAFLIAGLNFRFGWIAAPGWSVVLGTAVFLLAYLMYAEVLRENSYLSRTVEVTEDQELISTGLYGIVRHPMYCATIFLFPAMGLVLGSPVSFLLMLLYIPIIGKRIRNEEEVLTQGLKGYPEYQEKVRWRLIPHVW